METSITLDVDDIIEKVVKNNFHDNLNLNSNRRSLLMIDLLNGITKEKEGMINKEIEEEEEGLEDEIKEQRKELKEHEEALIKALRKRDTEEEKAMLNRQPEGDNNNDLKIHFKENEELIRRLKIEYEINDLEDDGYGEELKEKKRELINEVMGDAREKLGDILTEIRKVEDFRENITEMQEDIKKINDWLNGDYRLLKKFY